MGQVIHVSVSGILKYQNTVLLVKRSTEQRYFPGYWCFPGGKLSSKDGAGDDRFYQALIREFKEELDINISQFKCEEMDITTTPDFAPYRFENHFFLIELDREIKISLDQEHSESVWIDLDQLDIFFSQPSCLTIPPIPFYLNAIFNNEKWEYQSQFLDDERKILIAKYLPQVTFYMVPSKALPPSKHTNVLLIGDGDGEKILVDPSPCNQAHIELLIDEFKNKNIKYIFISHWHPDHHEYSQIFSKKLNAPLLMSKLTLKNINQHWGEDYFNQTDVRTIEPGHIVNLSGAEYLIKAHPGHAEGQLGIEAQNQSWVFLSDVFQGTGSVVVENMDDYIKCLNELISYPMGTIYIPSHGFPIASNIQLKKLLAHRLDREQEVEGYLLIGLNEEQIFEKIYPHLDSSMKRFAIKNIRGHIERIQTNRTL